MLLFLSKTWRLGDQSLIGQRDCFSKVSAINQETYTKKKQISKKMAKTLLFAPLMLLCRLWIADASFQAALVLDMAKILLDNYCFPENLIGMQEAIQQAINSGEIQHISDRKTLAAVLSTGVQGALNDPRLTVTYEPNYTPVKTPMLSLFSKDQLARQVKNSVKLEFLDKNVGYLRIDRIVGEEATATLAQFIQENIWNKVINTDALILDLRYSTGGELSGVPYVVSYFSDPEPPTLFERIYERPKNTTKELWTLSTLQGERYGKKKDLIVLTSKRTNGAAEAVAYTLKNLNRAIVVGERTSGGSVKVEKLKIGDSGFYITIPVARSTSPLTGLSWELNGVSPSVNTKPKEALSRAKSLLAIRSTIPKAVQSVSDIIQRYYSFRDKVQSVINHLEATDFFTVISEDNLAVKLNYELQSVAEDPRLIIKMAKNSPLVVQDDPELETIPDDQSFLQALAESVFKVRILPGNTGYVRFDRFVDAMLLQKMEVQMVRNVWEPIKGTDNLIIDLRFNTGGPSDSLSILLSYLHDVSSKLQLFTIYDRVQNTTTDYHTLPDILGPSYGSTRGVYVLTSYHTISAGEEFAYLIQSLHRGTIVGEITSGNLLHSKSFNVKNTDIVITLPVMNFIDNNDECWLGGGVVPDAIVLADEAEEQALEVIQFHQEIRSLVEEVGELLGMHYALPEIAVNVKKTLHTKWTDGFYRPVIDYESLASQLTADLQEISADHRLHVFYCDVEPESMLEDPKIPTADEASYIINTLFKADVLVGNIGYLRFDMMADIAVVKAIGSQLVQVWNKLVNTYALIIDLRYNIGAYSSALPLLCTYLFDPEPLTHLYTIFDHATNTTTRVMTLPEVLGQRYRPTKEIYILTSHMTGSAAEAFTRTMKDLKRATVIGEPTVGGSLSSGTYQIGNSILYASIPNQVVLSADNGQVWGVSGVEPHVVAQGTDALKVAKNIIAAKN